MRFAKRTALFIEHEPRITPNGLIGISSLYLFYERIQRPLILRFQRFAAEQRKPRDERRAKLRKYLFRDPVVERFAVGKIPRDLVETVFATVGTARHEKGYPNPFAVGDIRPFYRCVVH